MRLSNTFSIGDLKNFAKSLIISGLILINCIPKVSFAGTTGYHDDNRPKTSQYESVPLSRYLDGAIEEFNKQFDQQLKDRGLYYSLWLKANTPFSENCPHSIDDFIDSKNLCALTTPSDRRTVHDDIKISFNDSILSMGSYLLEQWPISHKIMSAYSGITSIDFVKSKDEFYFYGPSIYKEMDDNQPKKYDFRFKLGLDVGHKDASFDINPYLQIDKEPLKIETKYDTLSNKLNLSLAWVLYQNTNLQLAYEQDIDDIKGHKVSLAWIYEFRPCKLINTSIQYSSNSPSVIYWIGTRYTF